MSEPVNPYVAEVADLLKSAGHNVTDTWTEAVEPTDHNIEIVNGRTLHLIWDTTGWRWIAYRAANPRRKLFVPEPGPATGVLAGGALRPDVRDVVAEVASLTATLVRA